MMAGDQDAGALGQAEIPQDNCLALQVSGPRTESFDVQADQSLAESLVCTRRDWLMELRMLLKPQPDQA